MKIIPFKQKVLQRNFAATTKPKIVKANEQALESWGSNLARLETTWRNKLINLKSNDPAKLQKLRSAFFKARFEFEQQLRHHSNLPHETILALEKRLEVLANELRELK